MHIETSRRSLIGCAAAFTLTPAVTFLAAPDPIPDLCARYSALDPVLDDLWARRDDAFDAAMSDIGPCDMTSHDGNVAWWSRYQDTEASRLDGEWESISDSQCRLLEQIIGTPATTLMGVVAKLTLWQETHEDDSEHGAFLIASAIADLEVLS
jgi:hypothetical protein